MQGSVTKWQSLCRACRNCSVISNYFTSKHNDFTFSVTVGVVELIICNTKGLVWKSRKAWKWLLMPNRQIFSDIKPAQHGRMKKHVRCLQKSLFWLTGYADLWCFFAIYVVISYGFLFPSSSVETLNKFFRLTRYKFSIAFIPRCF